ncbi:hypothetical protein HY641_01725 [Candidatus Woesearchaeota archaeon]|nr:hypothetical protein [Candidatus Woesearchaeota archaeon]
MVTLPGSMDDLVYFTSRGIGKTGHAKAWAYRALCPKCKKAKMGKPVGKDGSVKIRAKEYVCPACMYTIEKQEYEEGLTFEVIYICPKCGKKGEAAVPFKRKKVRIFDEEEDKEMMVESVRFPCANCKGNIDVVKKMKS